MKLVQKASDINGVPSLEMNLATILKRLRGFVNHCAKAAFSPAAELQLSQQ